ncbi:hypothetical protein VTN96DRAFT_191 [Rasamsonia emersonii]
MDSAAAAPDATCPPSLSTCIANIADQISFTPPVTRKAPPRPWERVPSTPFLARHKSRKIWKRFRTSMQALRGQIGRGKIEEKELVQEINASANADFLRGVKRLCLGIEGPDSQSGRGRSFLETKWELETGRRRRKVAMAADEDSCMTWDSEPERLAGTAQETDSQDHELACSGEETQAPADTEEDQRVTTPETKITDDVNNSEQVDPAADIDSDAADFQDLIATQESTLVRSALRMNSLDGDDAALLSEFLSRAQAKRAAKAAKIPKDEMKEELVPNSPTVRTRQALEELDKNSPSPQKPQLLSPSKAEKPSGSPDDPMKDEEDEEAGNPASPAACRRSSRIRLPKPPQRAPRPAVPNQIPLRRAKGTEFVFLQRTEAQELALTTRRNTRRNKGDALLPKYALQAMAKRQEEEAASSHLDNSDDAAARQSTRKRAGAKQVSWKEDQLVEYVDGKSKNSGNDVSGGADKKKTAIRRNASKSTSREKETVAASPGSTPKKPVRRLALPAATTTSSTTDSGATTSTKPISVGTPIPKRKKLTPKSPGAGLLKLPAKGALSKTVTSSSSKSGIKTTTSSTSSSKMSKTSSIPTSSSKGQTLLKAGPAGATPMAKRVRAKKVA